MIKIVSEEELLNEYEKKLREDRKNGNYTVASSDIKTRMIFLLLEEVDRLRAENMQLRVNL